MTPTTKATTELDRVFEEMSAPEYPATCDQCGEVGTNQTMAEHECNQFVTGAGNYQTFKHGFEGLPGDSTTCRFCERSFTDDLHSNVPQPERAAGEHTSLPWRVGEHPGDSSGTSWRQILADTQPFGPAFVGSALESDAQLIVTAVNNHTQLVAALENCVNLLAVATSIDKRSLYSSPVRQAAIEALSRVRG